MKKIFALTAIILMSFMAFTQNNEKLIPVFDDAGLVIKHQNDKAVVTFKVKASEAQLDACKTNAAKRANFSSLTVSETKDSEGFYTFTVSSTKHTSMDHDKQYFVKVLMSMGMETFMYKGVEYEAQKFPGIVK
ncbi:MAG: hypothetical protein A2275_12360 [Bacteroidetes bacterium RIFOXYA12_FULL_35_11]|nr:MAG: hypothetical protein A2X01_02415 [Bacteroidetes bacterium GWF2_35_48]OFY77874.1 MAG: hypothetical protein A2275_12360 [Bacteroidetes bacterium RIFOXYA12_FULL_35_11]OFY96020.1 MAG: hypothetical protein A2491_05960 [Bacteroidetes bacterium RIFOXYC12_FULL_35_7]HBX50344.1 hypothetical protein [Bacteroidales bacterium]